MALDPDKNPKEFLTVLVAGLLLVFNDKVYGSSEAFKAAAEFVDETERRVGKLNP